MLLSWNILYSIFGLEQPNKFLFDQNVLIFFFQKQWLIGVAVLLYSWNISLLLWKKIIPFL